MRRLFLSILLVVFIPCMAWGQTWHSANQKTMAWDATTTLEDGSPIPSGEVIRYNAYVKNEDGSGEAKINTSLVTGTTYVYTFTVEGRYFLGLSSVRTVSGNEVESDISWSDEPAVCQGGQTFGVSYIIPPAMPKGLRLP